MNRLVSGMHGPVFILMLMMVFFFLGFVTAAFTNFNLVALGVIGTVMAVLYIQLSPKYNRVAGAPVQAAGNNDLDNELD